MGITASGTRITQQNAATTTSTMSITPAAVGNIFILVTQVPSATITASSVSGGSCTWSLIPNTTVGGSNINSMKMWLGIATSTSAANITVTWSASATGLFPCTTAQQFASNRGLGSATPWTVIDSNSLHNSASATLTYPSLTASASAQLYFGNGVTSTSGTGTTAGSTTGGWVWQTDGYGSALSYNLSIGPGSVASTTATNSPSSTTSDSLAAIITDTVGSTSTFFPFMV